MTRIRTKLAALALRLYRYLAGHSEFHIHAPGTGRRPAGIRTFYRPGMRVPDGYALNGRGDLVNVTKGRALFIPGGVQ